MTGSTGRICRLAAVVAVLAMISPALTGCVCCQRHCKPAGDPGSVPSEDRPLDVIEVEDAVELALLEQELALEPITTVGRKVYFRGDQEVKKRLAGLGYPIAQVDANEILKRVMRVHDLDDEGMLHELGLRVMVREKTSWVVYGSLARLRTLARLGYRVEDLRRSEEPRPRAILVILEEPGQVGDVARAGVDIFIAGYESAGGDLDTHQKRRFVVRGAAFDYAIDALREMGLGVEVELTSLEVEP